MNRRDFLFSGSMSFALAATTGTAAFAQELSLGQAEWRQNYDAGAAMRVPRSTTPILSPQALTATEEMIERYRDIVGRGGWRPVQGAERLRVGANNPAVVALRQRLIMTGDLDPAAGSSPVYDSYVEAGVRRFQSRHGVSPTGAMSAAAVAEMNVPAETRLRQLEVNVVRLRSFASLGRRYVIVNIPSATVETVEDGTVATRHAAGVGKIDRQSPIMNAKIVEINFNPFWTVPASIIRKDLIPKMQKEPNYLTDNKIRIYSQTGQQIAPERVNWNSDEATRYMFRQDPGVDVNSMGFVRINIPNPHGVYMHDTPTKGVFGDDFRFVSSGCVRVQNVRDYVAWILKDTPGWTPEHIAATIQSGQRVDARPVQPIPVHWTYITAWATPDGLVQFRDDIYKRDGIGGGSGVVARATTPAPAFEPEEQVN